MTNLVKQTLTVASVYGVNLLFTVATYAAFGIDDVNINDVSKNELSTSVTSLLNYFLGFLGLIAVAFIIYAGILMVTAGGDDEAIGKGKKIITFAAIGIVIILISYGIVSFVSNALGGTT